MPMGDQVAWELSLTIFNTDTLPEVLRSRKSTGLF